MQHPVQRIEHEGRDHTACGDDHGHPDGDQGVDDAADPFLR